MTKTCHTVGVGYHDNLLNRAGAGIPAGTDWTDGEPPKTAEADGWYEIVCREGKTCLALIDYWHSGKKPDSVQTGWGDPKHGAAIRHKRWDGRLGA